MGNKKSTQVKRWLKIARNRRITCGCSASESRRIAVQCCPCTTSLIIALTALLLPVLELSQECQLFLSLSILIADICALGLCVRNSLSLFGDALFTLSICPLWRQRENEQNKGGKWDAQVNDETTEVFLDSARARLLLLLELFLLFPPAAVKKLWMFDLLVYWLDISSHLLSHSLKAALLPSRQADRLLCARAERETHCASPWEALVVKVARRGCVLRMGKSVTCLQLQNHIRTFVFSKLN